MGRAISVLQSGGRGKRGLFREGILIVALKPTIYKIKIALSDIDRAYYDTLDLTVAQHPSETPERMMVRVLAFCLNAQDNLVFTNGLSAVDEPDIWARGLEGEIALWIDVGEPTLERIKKAVRQAPLVKVYSFNSKSDRWWADGRAKFNALKAAIFQFQWGNIQALAALVERRMDLSITVQSDTAYVAAGLGECEVSWSVLQPTPV